MNAELFIDILDKTLLPFIEGVYPEGHKFMQDIDPKHSSNMTKEWLQNKSVNWWKTCRVTGPQPHRKPVA